ncbi:MAG: polysaccharide deacetylase family protein [Clostridia bacterium]|nr:polysaccharide deacetylase family protein [Clostridia bacterium]
MFRQMFEEKYMRFPGGKAKALTFSYDDGVKADLRLLKVFEKYGLKGAFNLNSKLFDCENWHGRMDEETTFNAFYKSGQEVALHGARHIFLDKVPLPEAIKEVVDNRAYLEEKFGMIVRGMAYAYNGYNADVKRLLADLGVAYARTTVSTHDFTIREDFLEWNPTCHHTDGQLEKLADKFFFSSPEDEFKHREPWLFFVWGHSYEFDDDNNWQVIENLGKLAAEHKDIWHATNIEIYNYVQAYKRLVFSLDGERAYNPSAMPVWLEIRGKVYEIASGATVQFDK